MTEQPFVQVNGELIHAYSESDVDALDGAIAPTRVVVKRGRGRPRTEKPPTEKRSWGDLGRRSRPRRKSQ